MTALLAVLCAALALALYLLASARAHGAQLGALLGARETELERLRGDAARLREEIGRASCREECRSRWSPYH